jgi:hypothetical protein
MGRLISGYAVSQLIYAAAELGLADRLEDGPKSGAELARAVGADPDLLSRALRGLAAAGVVAYDGDGRFRATPLSRCLVSGAPGSLRALARCGDESYQAWGHLVHMLRTGETAFDRCFGTSRFEYLTQQPAAAAVFNEAMGAMLTQNAAAIVAAYDFSRFRTIVDVGGGRGALISSILSAYPAARGVLVDTPAVIADAEAHVRSRGVAERCTLVGADFFESVPAGGDAYLLSQTIHNWDDAHARRLLQSCRRAMAPGGVTLVIEMMLPPRFEGTPADYPLVMTDLQMMVMMGGRERTEAEHRALFHSAGLTCRTVIRTQSPLVILEAGEGPGG